REILPVILTVPGDPATNNSPSDRSKKTGQDQTNTTDKENPCDEIEKKCEDLLAAANLKEKAAAEAEAAAKMARENADAKNKLANEAREAADKAARAAEPKASASSGSITSDGETFTSADEDWLKGKREKLLADYQAGKMTAAQYQQRANALGGREALRQARKERLANIEKLKREAAEAKTKAGEAKAAADAANKAAAPLEAAAKSAGEAADTAKKAYEDCLKKAKDDCEAYKKEQEAAGRERTRAEGIAKQNEEERQKKRARNEYLITMIQRLDLIDSSNFAEVPSIWFWVPDIIEQPVGFFLEAQGKTPVPTDTLKAIGGLYAIFAKMKDPCAGLGIDKISLRISKTMIDPKTKTLYKREDAVTLVAEMCDLMRELKSKLAAIERARTDGKK
ncbi:MAG: hypothetical protein HKN25_11615, partial [Pyrinomonadaceae bacterium]|nr:hypothetical protein [Pyrinomonadaceae bacterium]